jgi:predicted ArsR family transcriptional regulator
MEVDVVDESVDMPRRKREIYDAIVQLNDWASRNQIADLTGKRRLSPNDVHHLESLVREKWVQLKNVGSEARPEYRYRVRRS